MEKEIIDNEGTFFFGQLKVAEYDPSADRIIYIFKPGKHFMVQLSILEIKYIKNPDNRPYTQKINDYVIRVNKIQDLVGESTQLILFNEN